GQVSRNRLSSSFVQNPITVSTPARLYQLRSKITISPAAGKCCTYRCMYICDFSRSDGAGSATTRNTRGLTRSVIARIVPPFPAHLLETKVQSPCAVNLGICARPGDHGTGCHNNELKETPS